MIPNRPNEGGFKKLEFIIISSLFFVLTFILFLEMRSNSVYFANLLYQFFNIITPLALVVLYYYMIKIQSEQTKISNRQINISESSHEPIIEVVKPKLYAGFAGYRMRNIGKGPIYDINLNIHIYAEDIEEYISIGNNKLSHIKEDYEDGNNDERGLSEYSSNELSEISSLIPGQVGTLCADIYTYGPNEFLDLGMQERVNSFGRLGERLKKSGVNEIKYQVEINFQHQISTKPRGRYFMREKITTTKEGMMPESLLKWETSRIEDNRDRHIFKYNGKICYTEKSVECPYHIKNGGLEDTKI